MSSLSAIREALSDNPESVALWLLMGRACVEDLQIEEAREAFEKALSLDPDRVDAHLGLARVLMLQGDASSAAVRAERVLQQEPRNAAAHQLLSRVFLAEGDRDRAVEHFDKAVQIDPGLADPALESDLGRSVREARKSFQSQAPGESPPFEMAAEAEFNTEEEDDFDDDPPFSWSPETFLLPGDAERGAVRFADVGGMEDVKEEVRLKILYPLQYPDLYKAYGRRAGGGILIYGPPGCGKTHMLRAVAGEASCNYLSVGLHEIFDPYFGSSERNLHQAFEMARSHAPCVLVFDDLDSLAQDRRSVREGHLRNVVNQFLHEMDGIRGENQRVLVIGATNQPWTLDAAFRRPGRFDQAIFVPPPDDAARMRIIELLARDKPVSKMDVAELARVTAGFSGADLRGVFERAAELALASTIRMGQAVPIRMETLMEVAAKGTPSTRSWFEGVKERPELMAAEGLMGEVKKFMNAPTSRER
jgi:AAA+ superfamily predicted ATPase